MARGHEQGEWTGWKGKLGAWAFSGPLRRMEDCLIADDARTAILREISGMGSGNLTVLDVGAGAGYLSLAIAGMSDTGEVICLDLSNAMLNALERGAVKKGLKDKIRVLKVNATTTGLDEESVDVVVSMNMLHELSDPREVMGEMMRVLKAGGLLVVSDFGDNWVGRLAAGHEHDAGGPFSTHRMRALLSDAGLRDVRVVSRRYEVLGVGRK